MGDTFILDRKTDQLSKHRVCIITLGVYAMDMLNLWIVSADTNGDRVSRVYKKERGQNKQLERVLRT